MKNFGEKIRMKTFLMGVWLEGGEGKKLVEPRYFLSEPTKIKKKLNEKNLIDK